jgi:Flp pilus assembly protein TadD
LNLHIRSADAWDQLAIALDQLGHPDQAETARKLAIDIRSNA